MAVEIAERSSKIPLAPPPTFVAAPVRAADTTPEQIVAFALALAGPAPAEPLFPVIAGGGADPRYPVAASPCPTTLAPLEVEGLAVSCGKVNVPENHDRPDGRRPSPRPCPTSASALRAGSRRRWPKAI